MNEIKVEPLGNHVAVELNEISETNAQGVLNPTASEGQAQSGTVFGLPERHGSNDHYFTEDGRFGGLTVGDKVMVHKHGGSRFGNILLINYKDLICKI